MLRCLFQPPEESRRRGGVGVQWGEGWGCLPWPPGLSPAPLLLSPLSPTHSLLLSPVSTYGYPLGSPSLAPRSLLLLGVPMMGGTGTALLCPTGLPLGPGGAQGPGPPELGAGRRLGAPWLWAGRRMGGLAWTPLPPIPGIAAIHPEKCQLRGGRRCWGWGGGTGPHSHGMNPEPVPGVGRGLRGDPEPAAGTVRLSGELAQATTCSPQPLLPVPSLPPSCRPPGPGLILTLALLLRSCKSRASLSKPKERARGLRGAWRGLRGGRPLGRCQGSVGGQSGGQEGGLAAGRRQGQKVPVGCRGSLLYSTSCCCWVASLTTCKERGTVRCHSVLAREP